jgi:hypothetical protein
MNVSVVWMYAELPKKHLPCPDPRSNPIYAQRFIATATDLLGSERYTTLGMALTGRRPAEIFFSAKFSLQGRRRAVRRAEL